MISKQMNASEDKTSRNSGAGASDPSLTTVLRGGRVWPMAPEDRARRKKIGFWIVRTLRCSWQEERTHRKFQSKEQDRQLWQQQSRIHTPSTHLCVINFTYKRCMTILMTGLNSRWITSDCFYAHMHFKKRKTLHVSILLPKDVISLDIV